MNEIPSMWRKELLHPLFVHFPIGLLIITALVGIAAILFRNKKYAGKLRFNFSLQLFLGIILFWITFYTGQIAYGVEVRKICDPTVLKDHLYWAYVAGYIFSAGALIELVRLIWRKKIAFLLFLAVALSVGGALSLTYAGHLGARVVYQQAAGVYHPSPDCTEFE
ncbi:hypothetical protein C7S20_00915 [Christiangramia fulva]|uniref:DUF2231 domain-containing protein n=1 Tax=Christiangramia fulva TaxID=2126553 RepID=A0A2R3Z0Z8_9FLAO|nr:DUF2231 domain-containing protein [Christiangramia fulva]AVR43940.1 hypothetical protein C7S20_00915 [Christiangramia fulva]